MKSYDYVLINRRPFEAMTRGENWRVALWDEAESRWSVFTGKRGGKLRRYKTLQTMDAAMLKIGMKRSNV